MKIVASILFAIGLLWGAERCYYGIAFNVDCGEHIKRAADANTVDLAIRELETAIRQHIDTHNQDPKPFVWTKSADQIFESLGRFCSRISDSGH